MNFLRCTVCADGISRESCEAARRGGSARALWRHISRVFADPIARKLPFTMSRYLHSFADKASSALNQSGLAQKLPSSVTNALNQAAHPQGATQAGQPGPPGTAPPPSGGAPGAGDYAAPPTQPQLQHQSTQESMAAGGGGRGFGFENLQHQFRALQVQYSCEIVISYLFC
jgi:hypothetical protein